MNPRFETTADLNVRSGPGVGYKHLDTLPPGREVEEVLIPDWCPISLGDGAVGWVNRKYLTPVVPGPEPIPGQKTGEMILAQAETHLGQRYVLGARADLNDPNYAGPWDCAEMITFDVKMVTGKIYGALTPETNPDPWTGAWYADMKAGKVIEIPLEQAMQTPGAILLRFDKQVQHIVFVGRNRTTVEARGAAYGVCRHVVDGRGFQYGILIPNVEYTEVRNG